MKKSILLLLVSGFSCAAMAQFPDTTNKFIPVDSTVRLNADTMVVTTTVTNTDTTLVVADSVLAQPAEPMSTDVKKDTNVQPAPVATEVAPATTEAPAPVEGETTTVPATPVETEATVATPAVTTPEPAATTNSSMNLPRGVNVSPVVVTGLNRWSALPILNTWVPQEIVERAKGEYGDRLYDITTLKTGENQWSYSVRIHENGVYSTVVMNDGAASTAGTTQQ